MIRGLSKKDCCGCSVCSNICPQHCIEMTEDSEGFFYPQIDALRCTECGACMKHCPVLLDAPTEEGEQPEAYAAMNQNEEERLSSSSGGVFTLLAKETIRQGGAVFGAAFSQDCRRVIHVGIEEEAHLNVLQGSKYVQSTVGTSYRQVKTMLEKGRQVLFSGTPCQIEGLKAFLKTDYDNLLCVDIICHGVPSPKVWRKYLDYRCGQANAPVQRMSFRHKKDGWKTFSVLFEFLNNTVYEENYSKDFFMQTFLQNVCLRPSCSNCHFKKMHRVSDITLGDFWGIENVLPEMDDDKGTSLVLLHSKKGKEAFDHCAPYLLTKQVSLEKAIANNTPYFRSVHPNKGRARFFEHLDDQAFDRLAVQYAKKRWTWQTLVKFALQKMGLWDLANDVRKKLHDKKTDMLS